MAAGTQLGLLTLVPLLAALLAEAFSNWRGNARAQKEARVAAQMPPPKTVSKTPRPAATKRKREMQLGMTGLRNLGQTCFMNAVLQVMAHTGMIRLALTELGRLGLLVPSAAARVAEAADEEHLLLNAEDRLPTTAYRGRGALQRQTTIDCYQELQKPARDVSSAGTSRRRRGRASASPTPPPGEEGGELGDMTLCQDLESLFRVLWSGKWAVVSPHSILDAMWRLIPSFRGFKQQDAQELNLQLMQRILEELELIKKALQERIALPKSIHVLSHALTGESTNTVVCAHCRNHSRTTEPFTDLSIDIPDERGDLMPCLRV